MAQIVEIKLYGDLGEQVGKTWNLAVSSVGEAIHAINVLTKQNLYRYLYEKDKENIRYQVLINDEEFTPSEEFKKGEAEAIQTSELTIKKELKKIEFVPIIEGGDKGIITAVLGVVLIAVGVFTFGVTSAIGVGFIVGGLGLLAAGIMSVLAKPPQFEDFREANAPNGKRASYLFGGPVNTISEGGPVPLGYGRLIVGSQVISTTYEVTEERYLDDGGNPVRFVTDPN